jgi:hypothetical protein
MSDLAKKARAALKSKAERLGKTTTQKVDSSTWTPAEPLNADVKTGLRPISRRAYKKGGKVTGEACATRADRMPRKNGGKAEDRAEAKAIANAKINRNVKAANEEREGIKHIGGMKKGGRAKYQTQGRVPAAEAEAAASGMTREQIADRAAKAAAMGAAANRGPTAAEQAAMRRIMEQSATANRKSGGRTKKADGGAEQYGPGVAGAMRMLKGSGRAGVPSGMMQFGRVARGALSPAKAVGMGAKKGGKIDAKSEDYVALRKKGGTQVMGSYKKGGETGHADEAMDKALIKKMVKSSARTGKKDGGKMGHSDEAMDKALIKKMVKPEARKEKKEGGFLRTLADKVVGEVAADEAKKLKDKILGDEGIGSMISGIAGKMKRGGKAERVARKAGGRTKGKTNINIVIAAGKPAGGQDMMGQPPGGIPTDNRGAGGIPIPVSQPPGGMGGMPGGAMPIPMPIPMPAAGGPPAPAGGMPMGRKSGGRVSKVASSYKDMEAGAGSGEGRLQKTDIAKKQPKPGFQKGSNVYTGEGYPNKVPGATGGRTARKVGGRTYRSYKDMDAGAGSGLGRLEKTEIQSRK